MSVTTFRADKSTIDTLTPAQDAANSPGAAPSRTASAPTPTPVPKELVHRAQVCEVLLTDWSRLDDSRFTVTGRWMLDHRMFTSIQGRHDPLIAAETFRQAAILLAHAEFNVPLDHHFLMWDLSVDVRPEHLYTGDGTAAVEIEMTCHDVTWRRGSASSIRYTAVFRRDGQTVATAGGTCTCAAPAVYRRLRGERVSAPCGPLPLVAPTAPQHVGRTSPMDVVLSPTGEPHQWLLRADTRHPVLFDHEVDHVPGMVLLEAARQCMVATLGHDVFLKAMNSEFKRYVEMDAPCLLEVVRVPAADGQEAVRVTGRQGEDVVFSASVAAVRLRGRDVSASTFHAERPISPIPSAQFAAAQPAGRAATGSFQYPSLTTTVPKEFVHRASIAEVLLTNWERRDDRRFTVAAQWPRTHSFFTSVQNCHDPLMVAETFRQAGVLLAHTELGVPLGHQLLVRDLGVHVQPEHLGIGDVPASVELEMTCSNVKQRGRVLAECRYDAVIRRDGDFVGTAYGTVSCMAPTTYKRVRSLHGPEEGRPPLALTAPVAPQLVGRSSPKDVVLSPAEQPDQWRLRADRSHPILFDHPLDHVPGMLLLEAARQSASATLGHASLPLRVESEFERYVELDAPCLIETSRPRGVGPAGEETVVVTARQAGEVGFRCTVTLDTSAL
ncbi:ScbA/BarX family gamma-butyrolactone biosynthesis protein [Streptomyces sp. NPDC059524]|uniref:ScbA/BarX family gamma-butyrolactone biosynthesis protein n=1 Tax=Streptomyces sp. NPDC059524 TaxID=3346856 RepID=UPI0036A41A3E